MNPTQRPVYIWLLTGAVLIAIMVVLGGITRLTQSGLSMVDWDPIMGAVPPTSEAEWQETFEEYKQFPEYQKKNVGMELEGFKRIFFWEYLHRMWGRMMGLVFIIPFSIFLYQGRIKGELLKQCLTILLGGALVGGIGWFMVLSGLKDIPDVSHYRLATHLLAAFLLFAYVLWTAFGVRWPERERTPPPERKGLLRSLRVFFVLLLLQVIYGAFVAGTDAGYLFNTWPKMQEYWVHPAVLSLEPGWLNLLEGKAGVQFVHRSLGILLLIFGERIVYLSAWKQKDPRIRNAGILFGIILLLQFVLGIFTLVFEVPVVLGVLHQFGALCLLASSVLLIFFSMQDH